MSIAGRSCHSRELTSTKIVVDSMHERKLEMAKRSCGFVCLPGGYGTFEEVRKVPSAAAPRAQI